MFFPFLLVGFVFLGFFVAFVLIARVLVGGSGRRGRDGDSSRADAGLWAAQNRDETSAGAQEAALFAAMHSGSHGAGGHEHQPGGSTAYQADTGGSSTSMDSGCTSSSVDSGGGSADCGCSGADASASGGI